MYYIVYSSITFATAIKNKYRYHREAVNIMHTPSPISGEGCSYCLEVKTLETAMEIVKASKEYGINIKGLYRKTQGDSYEELKY